MALTDPAAGQRLITELTRKMETLPILLRPHLGVILGDLLVWVESVETRFTALQKLPSADALRVLTQDIRSDGWTAEEIAARQRPTCEGCDE
jgi:hypothetical protein